MSQPDNVIPLFGVDRDEACDAIEVETPVRLTRVYEARVRCDRLRDASSVTLIETTSDDSGVLHESPSVVSGPVENPDELLNRLGWRAMSDWLVQHIDGERMYVARCGILPKGLNQ